MPERLLRSGITSDGQRGSDDRLPDVSQLVTTRLKPRPSPPEPQAQQIAEHQAEIQHLVDLAAMLEQAISALMLRLRLTTDPHVYAALRHNSADLQHFKLEVELLQEKHQHDIEHLRERA